MVSGFQPDEFKGFRPRRNLKIPISYLLSHISYLTRKDGSPMNYADIKRVDVANGPGVRVSLFVSG